MVRNLARQATRDWLNVQVFCVNQAASQTTSKALYAQAVLWAILEAPRNLGSVQRVGAWEEKIVKFSVHLASMFRRYSGMRRFWLRSWHGAEPTFGISFKNVALNDDFW